MAPRIWRREYGPLWLAGSLSRPRWKTEDLPLWTPPPPLAPKLKFSFAGGGLVAVNELDHIGGKREFGDRKQDQVQSGLVLQLVGEGYGLAYQRLVHRGVEF